MVNQSWTNWEEYPMEKRQSLQKVVLGKLDSHMQKNEIYHCLTPYTKTNSKWMKTLNVRQESIKILEENIGSNLFVISHSNFFHGTSPKAGNKR